MKGQFIRYIKVATSKLFIQNVVMKKQTVDEAKGSGLGVGGTGLLSQLQHPTRSVRQDSRGTLGDRDPRLPLGPYSLQGRRRDIENTHTH